MVSTYALEKALLVAEGASIHLSLELAGRGDFGWEFAGQSIGVETLLQGLVSVDLALTLSQLFQLFTKNKRVDCCVNRECSDKLTS